MGHTFTETARHCNAFLTLHDLGYKPRVDFEEIAQGFLNENYEFLTREEAYQEAIRCDQLLPNAEIYSNSLFSEDVW